MKALFHMPWRLLLACWAISVAAIGQAAEQEAAIPELRRPRCIVITFDESGSMHRFDHQRIRDYVRAILFSGFEESKLRWPDKIVGKILVPNFVADQLYRPGDEVHIYRFGEKPEKILEIGPMAAKRGPLKPEDIDKAYPRYFPGTFTDIAAIIETVCKIAGDERRAILDTYWVYVSDDWPEAMGQVVDQFVRIQKLKQEYSWEALLILKVQGNAEPADRPPFVQVHYVITKTPPPVRAKNLRDFLNGVVTRLERILNDARAGRSRDQVRNELAKVQQQLAIVERWADNNDQIKRDLGAYLRKAREGKALIEGLYTLGEFQAIAPSDGAVFAPQEEVALSWEPCRGAVVYQLRIAGATAGPVEEKLPTTRKAAVFQPGNYEWLVLAADAEEDELAQARREMTGGARRFTVVPPIKPFRLIEPKDEFACLAGTVSLSWSAAENGRKYEVVVDQPGGKRTLLHTEETRAEVVFQEPGSYKWSVWAADATGKQRMQAENGPRSIRIERPLGSFQLSAPGESAGVLAGTTVFKWTASENAARYELTLEDPDGQKAVHKVDGVTKAVELTNPGRYRWTVQAYDALGLQSRAAENGFRTVEVRPPLGEFRLEKPAADQALLTGDVELSWTPCKNARAYKVTLRFPSGTEESHDTGETRWARRLDAPGRYRWQVAAIGDAEHMRVDAAGGPREFEMLEPVGAFTVREPADGASRFTGRISFAWSEAKNACTYELILAAPGRQPQSIVTSRPECSVDLTDPGEYSWRVLAKGAHPIQGEVMGGPVRRFMLHKPLTAPVLKYPVNEQRILAGRIKFRWEKSAGAVSYVFGLRELEDKRASTRPSQKQATTMPVESEEISIDLRRPGRYAWYVCAVGQAGPDHAAVSEEVTFRVRGSEGISAAGRVFLIVAVAAFVLVLIWCASSVIGSFMRLPASVRLERLDRPGAGSDLFALARSGAGAQDRIYLTKMPGKAHYDVQARGWEIRLGSFGRLYLYRDDKRQRRVEYDTEFEITNAHGETVRLVVRPSVRPGSAIPAE